LGHISNGSILEGWNLILLGKIKWVMRRILLGYIKKNWSGEGK
jgi:hypothetical protein